MIEKDLEKKKHPLGSGLYPVVELRHDATNLSQKLNEVIDNASKFLTDSENAIRLSQLSSALTKLIIDCDVLINPEK